MPGILLTIGTPVMCQHGGQGVANGNNPRVKINGQPVVTQTNGYTINGCSLLPSGTPYCATAPWVKAAARIKAGNVPVLLIDSQATCVASGTGVSIISIPSRVKGV